MNTEDKEPRDEALEMAIRIVDHLEQMCAEECRLPVVDRATEYIVRAAPKESFDKEASEWTSLRAQLEAAKEQISDALDRNFALSADVETLQAQVGNLDRELEAKGSENDKLRAEVEEERAKRKDTAKDFETAFRLVREENTRLTAELDAVRKELEKLRGGFDALGVDFHQQADELEAAQARCGELENLAIGILRTLDAGCEVLPSDMQRWWAAVNLTPSQQPDNFDSSGGIGRRTSNEADRLARAEDSMGVQVHPAVTPSRPEPVKSGEWHNIEFIAANVHDAWITSKRASGVRSRLSESGEELMVPYAQLSEAAKELDRTTVRTVLSAIPPTAPEGKATEGEG